MNILNIFYGENIGGIEKNIEFLSKIFGELKLKNYFLYYSIKKNNFKLDGNIKSLNENIKSNIFIKIFRPIKRAYKIKQHCKKNKIKYSVSHGDSVNISNIISKILFRNKSKIIITINNSIDIYKGYFVGKIMIFLLKILYKKSDKIICISKEMKYEIKNYLNINKNKITTIYNGINLEKIKEKKNKSIGKYKKLFEKGKINFIHIARLDKIKNQKFIIDSFNEYNKKNKNSQLIIIGDGVEKNILEKIIKEINGESFIKIIGFQKNIYKFLNNSNYFLFASKSEGFGRSLIESISCGIPILTHDFKYGAKEIIRNTKNEFGECKKNEIHENGILVPYGNKEQYIKGLFLLSETDFNKEKIIKNSNKFDLKKIKNDWSKILQKI